MQSFKKKSKKTVNEESAQSFRLEKRQLRRMDSSRESIHSLRKESLGVREDRLYKSKEALERSK